MSKRSNPYKRGNYNLIMAFILTFKGKPFTKEQVIDHAVNELKMTETGAKASVGVVLSPRQSSERGDCRGNFSAQGHLYFLARLKRKYSKDEDGKETKETQRYQLRWRKEPLPPFKRENKGLTEEEITQRAETKAAKKVEREAKIQAEAEAVIKRKAERAAKKKAEAEAKVINKAERHAYRDAKAMAETAEKEAKKAEKEAKRQARVKAQEEAKAAKEQAKAEAEQAKAEAEQAKAEQAKAEQEISIPNETDTSSQQQEEQAEQQAEQS